MIRHCFGFQFRHDLNVHFPFWIVTTFDGIKQVGLAAFTVFGDQVCSFSIGQVLDALLGTHMEFYPEAFIFGIDKTEGVTAKTMHMTVTGRNPAVGHDNGHLMQSFRQQCPEIPVIGGAALVGFRVTFDCFIQVRELAGIPQEKYRSIVADQIPVAFFSIEF